MFLQASKISKNVCLAQLGKQFLEKQILKIILDILWKNGINSYENVCFRQTFLLPACSTHSQATWYSSLMSHHQVNNKCNWVKGPHWKWLIYPLCNFLLCSNICFQKQAPLFLKVSQIAQKNTCVGIFFKKKLQACRLISCLFFS